MHVVILACPESFLVPLRKGGYRGLLKKDSRQAGMTDNVSLLIAFLVLLYFSTVLSLVKAGHCIFTHSRPRKLSGPPRILPLYFYETCCLTIGKISRSNTMPRFCSLPKNLLCRSSHPSLLIDVIKYNHGSEGKLSWKQRNKNAVSGKYKVFLV